MILYLIRHAWAFERDATRWPDDDLRPLTDEGRKRFSKFVKRLIQVKFSPEMIASSPLVRCQETAQILSKRVPNSPTIVSLSALAPGSDLAALIRWTQEQTVESIAWVGHSPDIEQLAAQLIGDGDAAIRFTKGAVAAIRFEGPVEPRAGELQWLATAKLLSAES